MTNIASFPLLIGQSHLSAYDAIKGSKPTIDFFFIDTVSAPVHSYRGCQDFIALLQTGAIFHISARLTRPFCLSLTRNSAKSARSSSYLRGRNASNESTFCRRRSQWPRNALGRAIKLRIHRNGPPNDGLAENYYLNFRLKPLLPLISLYRRAH